MNKLLVLTAWLSIGAMASCQDTKLQTSAPTSADVDRQENPKEPVSEKVDPPVPVTGVYLNAEVLQESNINGKVTATIGISSYYHGIKVSDQRDRFLVTLTASPTTNTGTVITQNEVATGNYDHQVIVEGSSPAQVRNAYSSTMLYVTILDRMDNTTETWSSSLEAVLNKGSIKKTSSSTGTSVSTSGNTGVAGSAGLSSSPGTP